MTPTSQPATKGVTEAQIDAALDAFERVSHSRRAAMHAALASLSLPPQGEGEATALRDKIGQLQTELEEATNWSDIVDRHGTDQFDDLAEAWLALPAIQRVTNAVTSTFAKWANDELMARFRQHQLAMFHMAYVEGCLAGVKAAEAEALSPSAPEVGWVMVPKEPTPEMLGAWYRYKSGHHWPDEPPPRDTSDYGAYAAMLAASPQQGEKA